MPRGAEAFDAGWRAGIAPELGTSVTEWARANRYLTRVESAIPGRYRPEITPYVIEPMDCLSKSDPVRRLVLVCASQMIKTSICLTFAGYAMDTWPGSILVVQPTLGMVRKFSRQRVDQMIAASPVLREKVHPPKSRDSKNTVLMKEYDGGVLMMAPAGSAAELASSPILHLICDERDRWRRELGKEGDPGDIVDARTANFLGKTIICSSPTMKGFSPIWREFEDTDQRHYYVPCPHCAHMDTIEFKRRIKWEPDKPETARLLCLACGALIEEQAKPWMLPRGEWRPTATAFDPEARGYRINALYSPPGLGRSWAYHVRKFLRLHGDPPRLRAFVNTVLAELYEERGDGAEKNVVLDAAAEYFPEGSQAEVPAGVGALLGAIDTHDDRLEAIVLGFGAGEECWIIAHSQFHGDPAQDAVWLEADEFLGREYLHESGQKVRLSCAAVDTGGHRSEAAYRFCAARAHRRIFAVRGGNETGKPIVSRPTINNTYRTKLFTLCTDTAKEMIFARLALDPPKPGESAAIPGRMHFPKWVDEEFAAQLTSEKGVWKMIPGRGRVRRWVPIRERNEILDLVVYALSALYILGPPFIRSLGERAAALARKAEDLPPETLDSEAPPPRPSGWVSGWRG